MRSLALLGTILFVIAGGCSSSHAPGGMVVRACADVSPSLDGAACGDFTYCDFCPVEYRCMGGVLHVDYVARPCDAGPGPDGGSHDDASSVDAGLDAGPCAPHAPPSGVGCHVSSECDPARFEMCYAPGTSTGCGICVPAMRTCATDADCAASDFCESYVDPCTHVGFCGTGSDPTSTRCAPRCTASSCGAGERCGTDGRCAPVPCVGGGYACPTHTHCGDTAGGDAHGCFRDSCAFDADCGCGAACLSGSCYDTLGTCMSPAA